MIELDGTVTPTEQPIFADRNGAPLLRGDRVAVRDYGRTVAGTVIAPGTVSAPGIYMEKVILFPDSPHLLKMHGTCPHTGHSGHAPEMCPWDADPFCDHECSGCAATLTGDDVLTVLHRTAADQRRTYLNSVSTRLLRSALDLCGVDPDDVTFAEFTPAACRELVIDSILENF